MRKLIRISPLKIPHRVKLAGTAGVTLIEVMLALAVGVLFVILSFQTYNSFQRDAEFQGIKANVDQIFQAMTYYYESNCSQLKNTDGVTIKKPGTLDPTNNPALNFPVSLLIDLKPYLLSPIRPNPLLTGTYVTQFNHQQPDKARTILKGDGTTNTYPLGNIIVWTAQVAVQIVDVANIQGYKNILAADCISSYSGNIVLPCSQSTGAGDYLVWERLPSFTATNKPSSWPSMEVLKQFNQLYSTYPINYLTNGTMTTTQNYLCGG